MGVRSIGVEEEFLLLRTDGPALAAEGNSVVDEARATDGNAQFEHELKRAQAELASSPTQSLAWLGQDLANLRRELATVCESRGIRLVASGTSPVLAPALTTAEQRYREMTEQFGVVARQSLTCGMHVHVGVDSDREAVQVLDGIDRWLPVLTALSANSPFYDGRDTDYASYRSLLWGQWPTAGPTARFGDFDAYDALRRSLIDVGAARDDGMIYFDARVSPNYETVEIRVCDVCVDTGDAVVIAALARALVDVAAQSAEPLPDVRPEVLRAASWRAARWGMAGELVDLTGRDARPRLVAAWDLVDSVLELIAPALDAAGDTQIVTNGIEALRRRGTGSERQRAVYADTRDFDAVVDAVTVRPSSEPE